MSETTGPVDSTVACIICRELLEAAMFTISHIGAIYKNQELNNDQRKHYSLTVASGLLLGFLSGAAISIAVGYSVASVMTEDHEEKVDGGVEAGEGPSKLIAFFFVAALALKIPQWFGISNFTEEEESVVALQTLQAVELKDVKEVKDPEDPNGSQTSTITYSTQIGLALSLFWNALREATEGGVFTALAVLFSRNGMETLGASVGTGVGCAVGAGIIMAVGAKYVSASGFGIAATVITMCLASGLGAGGVGSLEEVYAINNNDANSGGIYKLGGTETGDILVAFGFIGINKELTVITLCFWLFIPFALCALQYWHNDLGNPLLPKINCCDKQENNEYRRITQNS